MYCRRNRWNVRNCGCNNNDELENNYLDIEQVVTTNETCECGFDSNNVFPENPMYAQSYVPWQMMGEVYKPEVGLYKGTIFPELVSPYRPNQSVEEIEYIRATNTIKEGCNR